MHCRLVINSWLGKCCRSTVRQSVDCSTRPFCAVPRKLTLKPPPLHSLSPKSSLPSASPAASAAGARFDRTVLVSPLPPSQPSSLLAHRFHPSRPPFFPTSCCQDDLRNVLVFKLLYEQEPGSLTRSEVAAVRLAFGADTSVCD
jgi:hypothetical protein